MHWRNLTVTIYKYPPHPILGKYPLTPRAPVWNRLHNVPMQEAILHEIGNLSNMIQIVTDGRCCSGPHFLMFRHPQEHDPSIIVDERLS